MENSDLPRLIGVRSAASSLDARRPGGPGWTRLARLLELDRAGDHLRRSGAAPLAWTGATFPDWRRDVPARLLVPDDGRLAACAPCRRRARNRGRFLAPGARRNRHPNRSHHLYRR
ncbi:hypothetical protein [Actinoplanes sp. NPDC049265]|uniref:hypothetical protein n=1 Tax=Actinoplanes sp. NPDC049265 TaxID=3363902 RepID=UPI00371DF300